MLSGMLAGTDNEFSWLPWAAQGQLIIISKCGIYPYPLIMIRQGDEPTLTVFCMALAAVMSILHSEHGTMPAERGRRSSDLFLGRGCRPISARGTFNSTLHILGQRPS